MYALYDLGDGEFITFNSQKSFLAHLEQNKQKKFIVVMLLETQPDKQANAIAAVKRDIERRIRVVL